MHVDRVQIMARRMHNNRSTTDTITTIIQILFLIPPLLGGLAGVSGSGGGDGGLDFVGAGDGAGVPSI